MRNADRIPADKLPLERPVALLWFRRDLRLTDNPALNWTVRTGRPVVPVFILDDDQPGIRPLGGASRWWLHGSLDALRTALEALGSRLILRRGGTIPTRCAAGNAA